MSDATVKDVEKLTVTPLYQWSGSELDYVPWPGPEWSPLMCGCGKQIGWIAKGGVQTVYCGDCAKKEMTYRIRWKNE